MHEHDSFCFTLPAVVICCDDISAAFLASCLRCRCFRSAHHISFVKYANYFFVFWDSMFCLSSPVDVSLF